MSNVTSRTFFLQVQNDLIVNNVSFRWFIFRLIKIINRSALEGIVHDECI